MRVKDNGCERQAPRFDMTPTGRWGTAKDIANATHFLGSEEACFITACDLRVDGSITPFVAGHNTRLFLVGAPLGQRTPEEPWVETHYKADASS